jgi:carboxylesterase
MPQPDHIDPSAYAAAGGPVGVLLIHGFTGSAAETRPMGQYLAERGMTVRCPLLSGHGTTVEDMGRIRWQQWAADVESALQDLTGSCEIVFVGGLSLGSLLTLWLGSQHPEIAGLLPMAPVVKVQNPLAPLTLVLRWLLKYSPQGAIADDDLGGPDASQRSWHYDETPLWGAGEFYLLQRRVRRQLPKIAQPLLIFQGRRDGHLHPDAGPIVYHSVASTQKTLVMLENSGHNLLIDGEREAVWAQSYQWMMDIVGARSGTQATINVA